MKSLDALAVSTESTVSLLEDYHPESAPKPRDWYATQSQQAGLVRLDALADLFSRIGDSKPGSFQPLLRALLIGGTGVGKSTLAREFARRRDWAYTSVDCGSWLIQGAYSKPPTLRILRDHVRSSNRCCIYLDEACKMFPNGNDASSGWYLSVFSEFILLLDGDERLKGHEWAADDIRKYKETCYVLCGGAFTEALKAAKLSQKRGGLGFVQAGVPAATHSSKIQEALPEEIYHRFGAHIVLESPTRQDYARGIEMIHKDLRTERAVPIKQLLDEAEASGNGTRWLTLYLTRVLLENPTAIPARNEPPPAPKAQGFDFNYPDTVHYCRQITKDSFALRGALGRLYAQYNRVRGQITQGKSTTFRNYIYGTQDRLEAKLQDAIMVCNTCGNITADDGHIIDYLMVWREIAWEGMGSFPNELADYGMLDLMSETWDLVSRVAELRAMVSSYVAAGRYSGVQS